MTIRLNKRSGGYAVVLMIALIAMLVALVAANTSTVRSLDRELKLLEKRQTTRWTSFTTNTLATQRP